MYVCMHACMYVCMYIHHIIWLLVSLHVRCIPQPNSQWQFWARVWNVWIDVKLRHCFIHYILCILYIYVYIYVYIYIYIHLIYLDVMGFSSQRITLMIHFLSSVCLLAFLFTWLLADLAEFWKRKFIDLWSAKGFPKPLQGSYGTLCT